MDSITTLVTGYLSLANSDDKSFQKALTSYPMGGGEDINPSADEINLRTGWESAHFRRVLQHRSQSLLERVKYRLNMG